MNTHEARAIRSGRYERRLTEERRNLLRFTCIWLASLVLLGVAWFIRPEPRAAAPRQVRDGKALSAARTDPPHGQPTRPANT